MASAGRSPNPDDDWPARHNGQLQTGKSMNGDAYVNVASPMHDIPPHTPSEGQITKPQWQLNVPDLTIGAILFGGAIAGAMVTEFANIPQGIIFGAILSLVSVLLVILSYHSKPENKRHPNTLLFYRTVVDMIFALRLLVEMPIACVINPNGPTHCRLDDTGNYCTALGVVAEFLIIASECWFVCMSVDLYLSTTNPFTNFKRNVKNYHIFSWGFPLLLSIIMLATGSAGRSTIAFCWTKNKTVQDKPSLLRYLAEAPNNASEATKPDIKNWLFLYVWIVVFIVFSIFVLILAQIRVKDGRRDTFKVRLTVIRRTRTYVLAFTLYWILVSVLYVIFLSNKGTASESNLVNNQDKTWTLLNFGIASKAFVNYIVWFGVNNARLVDIFKKKKKKPKTALGAGQEGYDEDLDPQFNVALRKEVLELTRSGIKRCLTNPKDGDVSRARALYEISSEGGTGSVKFTAYYPNVYKGIRDAFNMTEERLLTSLQETTKERISEGASGAFMYFSKDNSLIVKSMSHEECNILQNVITDYARHMIDNRDKTLLTRFYGCYSLKFYSQTFYFVVMANLFNTDKQIHYRYDIKGSTVNRNQSRPKNGKKVTCRHCNQKFIYFSKPTNPVPCRYRPAGHEPNVVLKDNDLKEKLRLSDSEAHAVYNAIEADVSLLVNCGIMDYSLLIGVSEVPFIVKQQPQPQLLVSTPQPHGDSFSSIQDSCDDTTTIEDEVDHNAMAFNPFVYGAVQTYKENNSNIRSGHNDSGAGLTRRVLREQDARQRRLELQQNQDSVGSPGESGQTFNGMRRANKIFGPGYYFIGVIDILQTWTLQKQAERLAKTWFQGADAAGLSALPPDDYHLRFLKRMREILGVAAPTGSPSTV